LKPTLKIISFFNKLRKNPTVINIITVAIVTIIVKGFGFYKEVVIAGTFGLSELLDTFFIAALVPGFVNEVFLNAFKTVFIPNYIAEQKSTNRIDHLQSTSFLVTIITALFFMGIAYLFTDVYLDIFFKGHTEAYYDLVKTQFNYLLPCILFWGLTSLLSGLLNVYGEFKYSSIYPLLTSITVLICLFFFKDVLQESVLAVGMLLGSIAQFIFLLLVALRKKIIKVAAPDFMSKNAITMFRQVPAKVSSGFLTGLIPLTDQYFAAQLVVGSIAALNYGFKIPAFFSTILILALGNVLLPYFSKLTLENKEKAFQNLYRILKWSFLALLSLSLVVVMFSESIVQLLFERNNFSAADTKIVSNIQIVFLLGVPFAICGNLIVKFLTSINKNMFMAYVSFGSMLLNILLDFILMDIYGILGIAICTLLIEIIRGLILLKYTDNQRKYNST
jgi:putative peptidoglycan lipid II flippase